MTDAKGPERVQEMTGVLRKWQELERAGMDSTARVIEETDNRYVKIVMEIIRHDSLMHHRAQAFLIESLSEEAVPLSREDLAKVWKMLEEHNRLEKKTVALAEELREKAWSPTHRQILQYLLTDENKHVALMDHLEELKKEMSRASGA